MLERKQAVEQNVTEKFGIYLNAKDLKVTRINSPYWIQLGPDWTFLTPEVNMTLLRIRQLAKEQKLVSEPDKLVWS
ncbi:MAG: hypothetical protein RI591_06470 [Dehalococcoidia bacterium]|nr:hypothetical protein [Dehalococcoidia bacterium]